MKHRNVSLYEKRTTEDLRTLLSKKQVQLYKVIEAPYFFGRLEKEKLEAQIHKIEVELTLRFYQMQLPL